MNDLLDFLGALNADTRRARAAARLPGWPLTILAAIGALLTPIAAHVVAGAGW